MNNLFEDINNDLAKELKTVINYENKILNDLDKYLEDEYSISDFDKDNDFEDIQSLEEDVEDLEAYSDVYSLSNAITMQDILNEAITIKDMSVSNIPSNNSKDHLDRNGRMIYSTKKRKEGLGGWYFYYYNRKTAQFVYSRKKNQNQNQGKNYKSYLHDKKFTLEQHLKLLSDYEKVNYESLNHKDDCLNKIFEHFNVSYSNAKKNNLTNGLSDNSFKTCELVKISEFVFSETNKIVYNILCLEVIDSSAERLENLKIRVLNTLFLLLGYCHNIEQGEYLHMQIVEINLKDIEVIINFLVDMLFNLTKLKESLEDSNSALISSANMLHSIKNKYGPIMSAMLVPIKKYKLDKKYLTLNSDDFQGIMLNQQRNSISVEMLVKELKQGKSNES